MTGKDKLWRKAKERRQDFKRRREEAEQEAKMEAARKRKEKREAKNEVEKHKAKTYGGW